MARRKHTEPTRHRPGKQAENPRRQKVSASVSEHERAMILQAAELYDMTISEYLRSCAMATAHSVMPELEAIEEAVVGLAYAYAPGEA
jgi:uncharacterized protein (DUF1778 family)